MGTIMETIVGNGSECMRAQIKLDSVEIGIVVCQLPPVRRARVQHRETFSKNIKCNFNLDGPITVHWDGKLLPDLSGKTTVDRLPILISSGHDTQLLGVPKLEKGSGENQANEICSLLNNWELSGRVNAMGFDTTAANTGSMKEACTLIEKHLGRDLLWFACRHHIVELLMSFAWDTLFHSTGSSSTMFVRFQSAWPTLKLEFEEKMTDKSIIHELGDEKYKLIGFIRDQLVNRQVRNDYKELLNLALAF
ncbi:uncharacterized protein LOC135702986 [Ochlerotatus camptorhynchus]|uniref:uncharacterized protein LOC135702986 n=1 Tax=Ochlerotatus camptorhynchus TaxID=644619 RepID=UPI0031DB66B9